MGRSVRHQDVSGLEHGLTVKEALTTAVSTTLILTPHRLLETRGWPPPWATTGVLAKRNGHAATKRQIATATPVDEITLLQPDSGPRHRRATIGAARDGALQVLDGGTAAVVDTKFVRAAVDLMTSAPAFAIGHHGPTTDWLRRWAADDHREPVQGAGDAR